MSEYTVLRSDFDGQDEAESTKAASQSALHLPLPASDSTAGRGRSSSILSMKNGVILLVIVNLLVWVFAVRYLRYIVSVFEDALADQRVETRALPRPDPLDGLLEFLEAKRVARGK